MDELERIAARAEQLEREREQADEIEPEQPERQAGQVRPVDPMEAAGNRAEAILRIAEGAAKMFFDSRLMMPKEEIQSGRESLAPVIDKYNLAGEGSGNLPYQEEIVAGFYLGGLIKRFRRAWADLRARDKAEQARREAEKQADNGQERKYQPEKQSRPIPGEVGNGKKPDHDTPRWDSEDWSAGAAMGPKQGSPGAPG